MSLKALAAGCYLASIMLAVTGSAGADAVADQKKAYKALGIDVGKNTPDPCNLLSRNEAAHFLKKAVSDGTSAGPVVTGARGVLPTARAMDCSSRADRVVSGIPTRVPCSIKTSQASASRLTRLSIPASAMRRGR